MPKKAYLAKHFSSSELKEKYLKSKDSVEARRWHLLWKISLGWAIKNSAIAVGCSYVYAQKILSRYNQNREEGVKNRKNQTSNHIRGKKRLLSQPQLEKLTRAIENEAMIIEIENDLCIFPKIYILSKLGKEAYINTSTKQEKTTRFTIPSSSIISYNPTN